MHDAPASDPSGRPLELKENSASIVAELESRLAAQAQIIESQAAALAHSRKIFDRSSGAARIGVWECDLADNTLTWTDMVYDLFDLPRGSTVDRAATVACYTEESARELHIRRSRAIEERTGFTLDAEIVTAKGNRRWIRITTTVESENGVAVRIFGMKQDITAEKAAADRLRYMAEYDEMTGLANRSQFQSKLSALAETCGPKMPIGALLLVDLDEFKQINDAFGHAAGDHCLKQAARRLRDVCSEAELVARIGGDEFAVVLGPHLDLADATELARRIVELLSRPVDWSGALHQLGASVGIALVDPSAPTHLFLHADAALYAAKAAGRSTFRIYKNGTEMRRVAA